MRFGERKEQRKQERVERARVYQQRREEERELLSEVKSVLSSAGLVEEYGGPTFSGVGAPGFRVECWPAADNDFEDVTVTVRFERFWDDISEARKEYADRAEVALEASGFEQHPSTKRIRSWQPDGGCSLVIRRKKQGG